MTLIGQQYEQAGLLLSCSSVFAGFTVAAVALLLAL